MSDIDRLLQMLNGLDYTPSEGPRLHREVLTTFLSSHTPRNAVELKHQRSLLRALEHSEIDRPPGTLKVVSEESGFVSITLGRAGLDQTLTLLIEEDGTLYGRISGGDTEVDDPIGIDRAEMIRNLFVMCFGELAMHSPWTVASIVDPDVGPDFEV